MAASSSSSSSSSAMQQPILIHESLQTFHSRKLMVYPTFIHHQSPPAAATPPSGGHALLEPSSRGRPFDANVVLVISVLLCALICSLGFNSIIRCAMRCSRFVSSDGNSSAGVPPSRLANTGVKKKALKTFPVLNYAADLKLLPGLDSECAICLSDFAHGERVRVLPKCNHGFHVRCIDRWLDSHSSCPTCRHCLLDTCHKIVGCPVPVNNSALPPPPPPPPGPPQETIVRIAPLQPEGLIHSNQHHVSYS